MARKSIKSKCAKLTFVRMCEQMAQVLSSSEWNNSSRESGGGSGQRIVETWKLHKIKRISELQLENNVR